MSSLPSRDERHHGRAVEAEHGDDLQLVGGIRVTEVDDDVAGHLRQQLDRVGQVSALWLIEVEQDGSAVTLAQLLAQRVESHFALGREAAED